MHESPNVPNVHRFFGQLKEVVTEKSQDSIAASTSMVDSGNAQRTTAQKADKKADKAGSKLEDIRTVVEKDDTLKALHDELDIGELFS